MVRKKKYPRIVFIGDGITDFEIVGIVDLLFVKKGSHLHTFITNHHPNTKFFPF